MDTLYTFRANITHYKTKSVHFWGPMNSATKLVQGSWGILVHRNELIASVCAGDLQLPDYSGTSSFKGLGFRVFGLGSEEAVSFGDLGS